MKAGDVALTPTRSRSSTVAASSSLRAALQARGPLLALAAVAIVYVVAQLVLIGWTRTLSWDEGVYASQVSPRVPPMFWDAHRALGMPLLVAPVVTLTESLTALRVYLTVLSGALLFAAYAPWLRLLPRYVAPLAAALFASLWTSLVFGGAAIPNVHVALGAVAATGLMFCARAAARPARWLLGVAVSVGYVSLIRPTDSLWLLLPIGLAVLVLRWPHRWGTLGALVAGAAIGWVPWLVESVLRFGGPLERLDRTAAVNGTGLHNLVPGHLAALDSVCSDLAECGPISWRYAAWWPAWLVLLAVGLVAAQRSRRAPLVVAAAAAASLAVPYLLLIRVVAPRYLMPAYAMAALPVAAGLAVLAARRTVRARLLVGGLLGLLLLAHLAVQLGVTSDVGRDGRLRAAHVTRVAAELPAAGVQPPCTVFGDMWLPLGYPLHCQSGFTSQLTTPSPPPEVRAALARGDRVVVVTARRVGPTSYLSAWTRLQVPAPRRPTWNTYVSP